MVSSHSLSLLVFVTFVTCKLFVLCLTLMLESHTLLTLCFSCYVIDLRALSFVFVTLVT